MTDDDKLKKIFQRYQKLLFKAANSVQNEAAHSYTAEFSKKIDEANATFRQLAKRYMDKAIPDVDMSEAAQTTLKRAGAFHETANVKLTTYVQMVSKLTESAEQFRGRIQAKITEDEHNGLTTTVSDLKEYIKAELKAGRGLIIDYKNGAKMPVDKYAEMLARTTRTETQNIAMLGKSLDDGNDLVECSTISPTCPTCAVYQGRIYSISGNTPGYPALYKTAFRNGYSCIHPNCRHQFFPYNPKFHTAEERAELEKNTRRPMDEDLQSDSARSAYTRSQMQMRQWNNEMNRFAEYQKLCAERGEEPAYKSLGAFRRAYRSEEGSLAYAKTHYYRRDMREFTEFESVLGRQNMPATLAEFQAMKYNKKEEFALLYGYKVAVEKQDISSLVSFKVYKQVSKAIDRKLVGKIFEGIRIKGKITHFIDRIIGEYQESEYKQEGKRQGVKIDDALDALQNPISKRERKNADGTISLTFISNKCKVTVNPRTGILIQTNKNSRSKI